jgi:hypothetical protein
MRSLPMIAMGVLAAQGCANDLEDEAERPSRTSGFFFVRRAQTHCPDGEGMCGGYTVSSLNASTTLCADGSRREACEVETLTLTALGLTEAQEQDILRAPTTSLESPELIVRGHLIHASGEVVMSVSEVWRSPLHAPVRGTFLWVVQTTPNTVSATRINAVLDAESVGSIDLTGMQVDPHIERLTHDAVRSHHGLLMSATHEYANGSVMLHAEQIYFRVTETNKN